ncbi:MAG: hypothetical protein IJF27_06675 [Oscillospiraceae bacterium]|nr:hypothetical protein [Oscillospiraceae bacterium]MBQ3049507.1 hypothetical protein [Oscillospiraceae bacterium]MBQ9939441.1 hypothetical protein [Oscillospiraceae bacterium]
MKTKKLFGKNIEPSCIYCSNGTLTQNGDMIMCIKKGMVETNYKCRKFSYDPLKRIPSGNAPMPEFSAEDFEL